MECLRSCVSFCLFNKQVVDPHSETLNEKTEHETAQMAELLIQSGII